MIKKLNGELNLKNKNKSNENSRIKKINIKGVPKEMELRVPMIRHQLQTFSQNFDHCSRHSTIPEQCSCEIFFCCQTIRV